MKTYLVGLYCYTGGKQYMETTIVQMEDDYNPMTDINLNSRVAPFMKLKMECLKQIPSGFHNAHHLLRDHMEHTQVISLSQLDVPTVGAATPAPYDPTQRENEIYKYFKMQLEIVIDDDHPLSDDTRRECLSAYTQLELYDLVSELAHIGTAAGREVPALVAIESKASKIRWIRSYFRDHPRMKELDQYVAEGLRDYLDKDYRHAGT